MLYFIFLSILCFTFFFFFFFFNDTATTEIYTLSLHDALPILEIRATSDKQREFGGERLQYVASGRDVLQDRKSTRLNSSHSQISYAVFCLKKKKKKKKNKNNMNTNKQRNTKTTNTILTCESI